ncbi:MAG: hypothetical protein IPM81_02030 [Saprospirales bacterium]|nr:hypothetical protein [Saprospirales bacterium]
MLGKKSSKTFSCENPVGEKQHATKDELSQTSQLCSESLVLLEKGLSSSAQTLSIQAYFYLMDAIAHFFAIAKLNDHSFLKDVFARLVKSVEKSIENDDPAMTNTAVQWLHWVKVFVEYFPDDIKNIVQIGISAFMEVQKSRGISIDNQPDKFPGLPWYPEALIFESVRGD